MRDIRAGQIQYPDISPELNYVDIRSTASQTLIVAAISYVDAAAAGVRLDLFFKQQRFEDAISFNDVVSIEYNYGRSVADILSFGDIAVLATGKGLGDIVSFADAIVVTWTISRTFGDSVTMLDNAIPFVAGLNSYNEFATMADAIALVYTKPLTDTATLVDTPAISVGSTRTETVSLGDLATRGVGKALAETLSISDNATVVTLNIESSVLNHSVLGAFAFNQ